MTARDSTPNTIWYGYFLFELKLFPNPIHFEWVWTKNSNLVKQILFSVHLVKHQIKDFVKIEVLCNFNFKVEHDCLLTAVRTSN
jgi:hypothetical protein